MRLFIGEYAVEVKALNVLASNKTKMNEKDTMYFLNYVSSLCSEASKQLQDEGYEGLSESAYKVSNDIYKELENRGFYD